MSDETNLPSELEDLDPREAEKVVAALTQLIDSVESQTIRDYLEETCLEISYLIDGDEDDDDYEDEDEDDDFDDDEDDDFDDDFDDEEDDDFDEDEDEDEDFDEEDHLGSREAA